MEARVRLHHPDAWAAIALRGTIGAGEAYAHGLWSSPDPEAVVRLLLQNEAVLGGLDSGLSRWARGLLVGEHRRRTNSPAGARRNIEEHYDLGDDLFTHVLDASMCYSCAWYGPGVERLEDAQDQKLERIVQRLGVQPGQRVLEVGTGWGALAVRVAQRSGAQVTTTTISPSQRAAACARIEAAGLAGRIEVLAQDYRHLEGRYERIVSIEMVEAVGADRYDEYFAALARHLTPGGRILLQAITIDPRHYERARQGVDFIQRYIFPGSNIPSVPALEEAAGRVGLRLVERDDWTAHYPPTLRAWALRLEAAAPAVRALGFDDTFLRLWDFYFAYCAGGFSERRIGLEHLVFEPA
ncbi:MAG: class I SAM-dependent methyltransferase [Planctomycetia bacterium]